MRKHVLFLLLLTGLWVDSNALAQGNTCVDFFSPSVRERLARLSPSYAQIYDEILTLPVDLLSGAQTPRWSDFKKLEDLIHLIREIKKNSATPEVMAGLESIAAQVLTELGTNTQMSAIANSHLTHTPTATYSPTEYDLKRLYQFMIARLNRELPGRVRLPLQRLPLDTRRPRLNQNARDFIAKFEDFFAVRLHTTGFGTFEAYERFIRDSRDPLVKKAVEMIDKGHIEVVIRRPESARFWVPKVGFQNQYVTGSSQGYFHNTFRQQAEARLYGLFADLLEKTDPRGLQRYKSEDPEYMPKYATLRPSRESGLLFEHKTSYQYGPDFYVIKLSDIQDRLTWTPGDSLSTGRKQGPIGRWDHTFIPWKYRLLMVDFMLDGLRKGSFGIPMKGTLPYTEGRIGPYWETQILGSLELANISSFEFLGNPPSGPFLLDLVENGITIYDARVSPSVEWKPTEEEIRRAQEERILTR